MVGHHRLAGRRRHWLERAALANHCRNLDVLADLHLWHYRSRRLWRGRRRCKGFVYNWGRCHRRRHSQLRGNHRLGRRAAHACRDQQQHSRLWCKRSRVGRAGRQHAQHLLRNLQGADKQRSRRLCIDLDTLLHRQLWRANHLACPCLVAGTACQQARLDTLNVGCPTVHARRHLGRLHLHARQLASVAYVLGKPVEHAPASTVKDVVEPRLGLATCCPVQGLGHRTRAELSNACQRCVELLLNLTVPVLELLDDGRWRPRRVAHLHVDLLRPQEVLALAVAELLAKRVEGVDVVLGDARLVGDVQEAPAQLVVDACVDGNLLPKLERLQAVTQHRPTLKLHRAGRAIDRVHQLACIEVVIAVGRREPSAAKEVTVGTPQHDRIVGDWVPLNLRVVEPTRKHEAEPHESVEQRVGPQRRAALNHPLVHDRVLDGRSPAEVHERQLLGARVSVVRPHHLLG